MKEIVKGAVLVAVLATPSMAYAEVVSEEVGDSGMWLMVLSYGMLWLLLVGYFVRLGRRQDRIESDLKELRRKIDAELGIEDE